MTHEMGMKLSALLDDALAEDEAAALKQQIQNDPALHAEFEALKAANAVALDTFAAMLAAPVPLALARAIDQAQIDGMATLAPVRWVAPIWSSFAAAIALVLVGAGGGYIVAQSRNFMAATDWADEILGYHVVYAAQTKHLVEVPASEATHIQSWFASQTGFDYPIPDLSGQGLTFQGGRLLVAGGKPVGQLMYTDAKGQIVALCFTQTDKDPAAVAGERDIGAFQVITWGKPGAKFILIAPENFPNLPEVAAKAQMI